MKRIISIVLALAIMGSALIFCYADNEIKLEARLDYDENGNVDMVFSIPENSHLGDLNLNVKYFSPIIEIDFNSEVSFKSLLSPEEEALMEWNVCTDRDKLMDGVEPLYPHTVIDGYFKGAEGLINGGDLFALKFKVIDINAGPDFNFDSNFKINVNTICAVDGYDYAAIFAPEFINYTVHDKNVISFSTTYKQYKDTLTVINDQSKLANITSVQNVDKYTSGGYGWQNGTIANFLHGTTGGNGMNGGNVVGQGFSPKCDYVRGVKVYMNIDGTYGTGYKALYIYIQKNNASALGDNAFSVTAGEKYAISIPIMPGGQRVYEFNFDAKADYQQIAPGDVAILNSGQNYVYKFAWEKPSNCHQSYYWISGINTSITHSLWMTPANDAGNWSQHKGYSMYFETLYDHDVQDFIDYANSLSTSAWTDYNANNWNTIALAQSKYNALTAGQKTRLTLRSADKTLVDRYTARLNERNSIQGKIDEFKRLVNAIGTVTASSSSAIQSAENYYNNNITGSGMKGQVSSQKSTLESKKRIFNAIKAINDIGTVTHPGSYNAINAAQNAYNQLTSDAERNAVTNYSTLQAAHNRYAELENQSQANNVINLINAIGTVTNPGSYSAINAAQNAYNALTDAQKALVTNYSTLTAAHQKYADLEKANPVIAKINAIGSPVAWNNSSKVTEARNAYNALNATQKGYVTNYSTLTAAETRISNMTTDKNALQTAVNNLGTLKLTHEYQTRLQAARKALDKVTGYEDTGLNSAISSLKSTIESAEATIQTMNNNVQNVINLINAIGTVAFNSTCSNKITAAQNAYNALGTAEEKAAVSNYNTLQAAHVSYAILSMENPITWNSEARVAEVLAAYNALPNKSLVPSNVQQILTNANTRITNMRNARNAYINAVNALPPASSVDYTTDHTTKVNAADSAYSAITAFNDTSLTNSVSSYRTTHTNVKNNYNTIKGKVDALVALINEIKGYMGSSAILDIATKIDKANKDFGSLTAGGQKWLKDNGYKQILENANVEYLARAEAARFDISVGNLSNPVKWDERNTVSSLRTTYNNMSASVQQYVTKLSVLSAAETRIKNMSNAVDKVVKETNEIAPVVYTNACEVRIKEARDALDAVTAFEDAGLNSAVSSQKATIEAAETKILQMRANVNNVIDLINAIGTVTINSAQAISNANNAYESLQTPEEKAAVTNYDKLKASHVMFAIVKVGTVTWIDKADVETARAAYNVLTDSQKSHIDQSYVTTLTNAEKEIARLKALIDTFVTAVNNIPTDDNLTLNDAAKITAAREAYNKIVATNDIDLINDTTVVNALNRLIKSEVRNVELLIDYIFASINIGEDDIGPNDDLILVRYGEKRTRYDIAQKAYNALTDSQKSSVRNGYKLDMAQYEFNVDDNFVALYKKAGIDGKKLNHQDTDARITFENAKIAVTAFNSEYGKDPFNYTYSYMIIPAANMPIIENKIKIIEGFNSCTKAWVENGRHTDPSDFDTSHYNYAEMGQDVRNDPFTDDSQTSIYFDVQPEFLKASTFNSNKLIGFNDSTDFMHCKVDHDIYPETTLDLQQTVPYEGTGALQMNMGAPLKEVQISEDTWAKVGGQFYYDFDKPVDLTSYNSFSFNFYTPVALQGGGGQIRVNFITDAAGSDGFNFVIDIGYAYTGWNTYTIYNRLNPTDTVAGADWTKIKRINFTWFNLAGITPKDAYGSCFFLFDNFCGLTTNWVDDTVNFDNGIKTAVFFNDNTLPANTKVTLVELVNSTTKRYYGFKTTDVTEELFLDDFVLLETKGTMFSSLNTFATAKSMTGVIKDGMSFILILDFSGTTKPNITPSTQYGRYTGVSINIYDRAEYDVADLRHRSTIYSITKTYIKSGTRRELSITANDTSNTSITKKSSITFSGKYSVSDVGTVNYVFYGVPDNGHKALDTYSQDKTISIVAKIKDSKGNYVPVNEIGSNPSNVSGLTYTGKGADCFYFSGGDANTTVSNKAFSFTISFANCRVIPSGTYTLELTISRVSNSNGTLGYVNNVVDLGKKSTSTSFNLTDVPQAGLNVVFESLNGNANTKFIDTTKNNTLLVDINHVNAQNYNLSITIQKKNSDGSYTNLTSSTYMTATTSRTLSTNANTKIDESITLKGTSFSKGSTYRLVFTMSSGNTTIVRYLNLLTTP